MVNSKIKLLIFDTDGTLLKSDKANYEALTRAFTELNWNIPLSQEEVIKHLGETAEQYYTGMLPDDKKSYWQELRDITRKHYPNTIASYGEIYPGVPDSLITLRNRGYKLALYSNAWVQYFRAAITRGDFQKYFDYMECIGDNNLTKIELIKKIKTMFTGVECAVTGDRIHDIEAARENNALSVGVLYGYGKEEPRQADITISRFSDLLDIFK